MDKILVSKEDIKQFYITERGFNSMLKKYAYLFPIKGSKELAGLVADIMGDGNLQGYPKWRFDFCSKSKETLNIFGEKIYSNFNINGKIRNCTTNIFGVSYLYGVNCKRLSKSLYYIGVPSGEKVTQGFKIPNWILEDKEYFREFISRLFICEGSVDYSAPSVKLGMSKIIPLLNDGFYFFNQIKDNLLFHFNIKTMRIYSEKPRKTRKDNQLTSRIILKIKRQSELIKFLNEINYPDEDNKQKILSKIKRNT